MDLLKRCHSICIQNKIHPEFAVKAMQSTDVFTVGGSIAVNAHGMDHRAGALMGSIRSLRVMLANGSIVTASREENPELFRHVIGGYGLFGIVTEATLDVVPNDIYQSARAVIPTIITQIASGKKQIKLGDVSPTRDFNYVLDTCRGFIELARSDKAVGQTVNIGSNYEISVGDTLKLIRELMGSDVEFLTDEQRIRPEKSEVFRLWCDNTKIHGMTGFKPRYDIRAGLQATIDWFINPENLRKYKSDIYNV